MRNVLLIIASIVAGYWIFGIPERGPRVEAASNCDRISAFVMSQEFVRRELKSPKTAEFPYISDATVTVTPGKKCRFSVASYVDAQNSFGALIRTNYTVDVWTENGLEWNATRAKLF